MVKLGLRLWEAEEITLREFSYEIYAYGLRELEVLRKIDMQAWQTNNAGAEKKEGKKIVPMFRDFSEFSKIDKQIAEMKGEYVPKESRFTKLTRDKKFIELLKQANK